MSTPFALALKVHNKEPDGLSREAAALKALHVELEKSCFPRELFPEVLGVVVVLRRTCLCLPAMGPDLYVLQRRRQCAPFNLNFVWYLAQQLFQVNALGLSFNDHNMSFSIPTETALAS